MGRYLYYLLVFCCLLSNCNKKEDAPTGDSPATVDRTVLVYMIGDNSLSPWVGSNMWGLMASYKGEGNLLVYIDNYDGDYDDDPKLVKLEMGDDGVCYTKVLQTYKEHNSSSPEVLSGVVEEVCRDFPAKSYGLVLWSHGTGWLPSDPGVKAFGQDGSNWFELNDLANSLPDHRFDFILFDACYMGGIEVAYALRNKTKYLIASPTEIWEDGFPYSDIVPYFWGDESSYRQICRAFFDFYNSKTGQQQSGTISLVKTAALEKLATATKKILNGKNDLIASLNYDDIQRIDRRGSLYWYNILYDFEDYIAHLSPTQSQQEIFKQALTDVVLYEAHTESYGQEVFYRKFSGLSCYIPQSRYPGLNAFYATLDWAKAVYQNE